MGKLILVVDDKQRLETVAKVAADRLGASVHAVAKVVLAKQFMIQKAPDLILVDAVIADDPMAGFKFCKELRGHSTFAQIPVVVIAESLLDTVIEEARNVSAQGVLAWPVLPDPLIKRIQPLLEFGINGPPQAVVAPASPPKTTPPQAGAASPQITVPRPNTAPGNSAPLTRPVPTATPVPPTSSVSASSSGASSVQDVLTAFSGAIKQTTASKVEKPAPPQKLNSPVAHNPSAQIQSPVANKPTVPNQTPGVQSPGFQNMVAQKPATRSAVESPAAEDASVEDKLKRAQQILASVLHNLKTSDLLQVVELEDIPGIVMQMTRKVCDPSSDSASRTLDDALKTTAPKAAVSPQKAPTAANPAVELNLDNLFGLKKK